MTHKDNGKESHPQAGHKMSEIQATHVRHAGHSVAMFRDKFWLSFALTIPVVFWSTDVQHWLGYTALTFPGSKFMPPILGTVVFVYGGLVFIRGHVRLESPNRLVATSSGKCISATDPDRSRLRPDGRLTGNNPDRGMRIGNGKSAYRK